MYCRKCKRDIGAIQKMMRVSDEGLQRFHAQVHVGALQEHLIQEMISLQQKIRREEEIVRKECFG